MNDWFKTMSGAIRRGMRLVPEAARPRDVSRTEVAGGQRYGSSGSRTERITLSIDPRRAQSYRIAVAARSIWSDRPLERGWGRPSALFEHLVTNMGVPAAVAAEKIADLERTGGPVSFESKHP